MHVHYALISTNICSYTLQLYIFLLYFFQHYHVGINRSSLA